MSKESEFDRHIRKAAEAAFDRKLLQDMQGALLSVPVLRALNYFRVADAAVDDEARRTTFGVMASIELQSLTSMVFTFDWLKLEVLEETICQHMAPHLSPDAMELALSVVRDTWASEAQARQASDG